MKKKTPAPKRAGITNDRPAREAAVIADLEFIEQRDPARFAELMRLLARLAAKGRQKL